MQVILSGDFAQLPPVPERLSIREELQDYKLHNGKAVESVGKTGTLQFHFTNRGYAFESTAWWDLVGGT